MKNNKIHLALLFSLLNGSFAQGTTIIIDTDQIMHSFNEHMRAFDDYFNAVQEEMCAMAESMNKAWEAVEKEQEKKSTTSQLSFDIEDRKDANNVLVEVKGVSFDPSTGIQAKIEFDDNEEPTGLLVAFAGYRIHLTYASQYRFLSAEMKRERKEEQHKDDRQVMHVVQVGTARHGKTLRDDIQLDQAHVTYDKKEETLTITLPKVTKKKTEKIIPINIK